MVDGNALEDILGLVKVLGIIAGILIPPALFFFLQVQKV